MSTTSGRSSGLARSACRPSPAAPDHLRIGSAGRTHGRAGCRVELRTGADLAALPPDLDPSGCRIVQEALTNTLKHAGPVPVAVQVDRTPGALEIRVRDRGPRRPSPTGPEPGAGQGLVGMRERVALFGGTLTAGPTAEGGWAVGTTLPIRPLPTSAAVRPEDRVHPREDSGILP